MPFPARPCDAAPAGKATPRAASLTIGSVSR